MSRSAALLFVLVLFLLSGFGCHASSAVSSYHSSVEADYSEIINNVNMSAIRSHVGFLSSLTSRGTGYPGNLEAAQYIQERFEEYGLVNISYQEFPVVVALDHGANITLLTSPPETFTIYPIEPNLVCPSTAPPIGIEGSLTRVEEGDFEGREVNGSIVLMDWNSEKYWLTAASLGAKAVIFIPPRSNVTPSAYWFKEKTVDLPLNFPRFYVPQPAADTLLLEADKSEAKILANTHWEQLTGRNIYGFVKGTKHPDHIVMISSYYDSGSIAPSLAPGAQEACGVASLLELARYFSHNPPLHSIMFVAFGGHHQSLEGSISLIRNSMVELTYNPDPDLRAVMRKYIMTINLDFSTGTDTFYETTMGNFYFYHGNVFGVGTGFRLAPLHLREISEDVNLKKPNGKTYRAVFVIPPLSQQPFLDPEVTTVLPWTKRYYDHEPFLRTRAPVMTFTTGDSRPYFYSPFDTIQRVDFTHLQPQVELTYCLLHSLLNYDTLYDEYIEPYIGQMAGVSIAGADYVDVVSSPSYYPFGSYHGVVGAWDSEKAWYETVPNALVCLWTDRSDVWGSPPGRPRYRRFVMADENGEFAVWGFDYYNHVAFSAWVVNESDGSIACAPDQGVNQYRSDELGISSESKRQEVGFLTVFNCSSVALFDVYSPESLSVPQVEESGDFLLPLISVLTAGVQTPVSSLSKWSSYGGGYALVVIAVPSDTSLQFTFKVSGARYPFVVLANASRQYPYGVGYKLDPSEQLSVTYSSLRYAENLYHLNEERARTLAAFQPYILESPEYRRHLKVAELIDQAKAALDNREYKKYYLFSKLAWSTAKENYTFLRSGIEDAAFVVPLFAGTLLPFIFLAEKLVFGYSGAKRVASFSLLFAGFLGLLYLVHPGFHLAASPTMNMIGFFILVLVAPILIIMTGKVSATLKELRVKHLGRHEVSISRFDVAIYSFFTGLENMKRRKVRSALSFVAVVCMVVGAISISSLTPLSVVRASQVMGRGLYDGIHIHRMKWGYGNFPLGAHLLDYVEAKYPSAVIAPRAWTYTAYKAILMTKGTIGFRAVYNGKEIIAPVLWGLTPQETEFSNPDVWLVQGRWFLPDEQFVCVLTEKQAERLGIIDLPVKVKIAGVDFTIIGVIDEEYGLMREIDTEAMTPIAFDVPITPNPWDVHVLLDECFIIDYRDALSIGASMGSFNGGGVASISIRFQNNTDISTIARDLFEEVTEIPVYARYDGATFRYSAGSVYQVWGVQYQVVPIAIAALATLNIILGTVYERKREIGVYGSLGLSPVHIMVLFLAENMVYALIGGLTGYVLSMMLANVLTSYLPGAIFLNLSSSLVTSALGISMVVITLSSIYPMYVSSKLVTPSLSRAWKIPTQPVEDFWEVPLPFFASSENEVNGVLAYISEYLRAHQTRDAEAFTVQNLGFEEGEADGLQHRGFTMNVRLHPYERGVRQNVKFHAINLKEERWGFRFLLEKISGSLTDWKRMNRVFLNLFRQQLLLWRTFSNQEKEQYKEMFQQTKTAKKET